MSTIIRKLDRTNGSRIDDRLSTQGLLSPNSEPEEVITTHDAAVEMTRLWKSQIDFQPLGNLAGEREIPTFPQADPCFISRRRT